MKWSAGPWFRFDVFLFVLILTILDELIKPDQDWTEAESAGLAALAFKILLNLSAARAVFRLEVAIFPRLLNNQVEALKLH